MINILSYIGMNVHSEVCLWTLLGLIRTIFDATLFRVNANLKQVWQMSMPEELSMPVQRVLRTMISGVMLVQCFTVYIYLASYIVLLYPVFLEERPTLVLPWLLLAAVRQLLCELTSLALGLGTCVLLGPARPPCIKFVIIKLMSIMPAFYTWMLLLSYYHTLKVASAFKRFPAVLPTGDQDYGLELAIRRRRTKSLLGEEQLRSKLVASLYGERHSINGIATNLSKIGISSRMMHSTDTSAIDLIKQEAESETLRPNSVISHRMSETGSYEDWFGSEVVLPRSCDRILEQFVLMLLRIGAYLGRGKEDVENFSSQILSSKHSHQSLPKYDNLNCAAISEENTDTPLLVGSSKENTASYLREYPQIFMKKTIDGPRSDIKVGTTMTIQTHHEIEENGNITRTQKRSVTISSKETVSLEIEQVVSRRKYMPDDKSNKKCKSSLSDQNTRQIPYTSKEIKVNYRDIDIKDDPPLDNQIRENKSNESLSTKHYELENIKSIPKKCITTTGHNQIRFKKRSHDTQKPSSSSSDDELFGKPSGSTSNKQSDNETKKQSDK